MGIGREIENWIHNREVEVFIGLLMAVSLWAILISLGYSMPLNHFGYLTGGQSDNSFRMFYGQLFDVSMGMILFALMQRYDMERLTKYKWLYLSTGVMLCLLSLVPPLGYSVSGAYRWVKIFNMDGIGTALIHSGLWAIVLLLVFIAVFFAKEDYEPSKKEACLILALMALLNIFILCQPDMPMVFLLTVLSVIILLFFRYHKTAAFLVLTWMLLLINLAMTGGYRFRKIITFLDPYQDAQGSGFQLVQSFEGIQQGGIFGVMQGKVEASVFIPAANTDFIFSFIAQQYGLLGILGTLMACIGFFYFGVRAAMRARNRFEANLTFLLAVMCLAMSVISIFVSLGMLPTMGMPMPFFSYGGETVALGFLTAGMIFRQLKHTGTQENILRLRSWKIVVIASMFCLISLLGVLDVIYYRTQHTVERGRILDASGITSLTGKSEGESSGSNDLQWP